MARAFSIHEIIKTNPKAAGQQQMISGSCCAKKERENGSLKRATLRIRNTDEASESQCAASSC